MSERNIEFEIKLSEISQSALNTVVDRLKDQISFTEITCSDLKEKNPDNVVEILKHEMLIVNWKKILNSVLDKLIEESKSHFLLLKSLQEEYEEVQQQNIH